MTEQTLTTAPPHTDLKPFDRLIGRWSVSGGAEGTVSYEWLDGGYFLLQRVDLLQDGQRTSGLELIGHARPFGEESRPEISSRYYDNQGNTLDYVYELHGDKLTIWAGAKGSPAKYEGNFSRDGDTLQGEWVYPGGGGYSSTMIRQTETAS